MPSKETLDRRRDDLAKEQEKYEAFMNKRKKRLTGANVSPMVRLDGLQTTETSQVNKSQYVADVKKKATSDDESDMEMDFGGKLLFDKVTKKRTLAEFQRDQAETKRKQELANRLKQKRSEPVSKI